jgi:site-specific recombinase XerD
MVSDLVKAGQDTRELGPLTTLAETAREYIQQAKAENTLRAYRADWGHFTAWCAARGFTSLPATTGTTTLYLTDLSSTHKVGTLTRRLSAISQAHKLAGHESPTRAAVVRILMAGIRRANGTAPNGKAPVLTEDIRAMVATLPGGILGIRDRALLLIGFAGAFRRSELVALDHADCEFTRAGLVVTIRRSKTDQEAHGRKVGIPYGSTIETCPVRALQAWLGASAITGGPLFRSITRHVRMQPGRLSGYAVALVVKRYAAAAGLDASRYSGHSLRAGLATSAAIAGASERSIMNQTGHRSIGMVRRYIRDGSLFRENAAAKLGL